MQSLIEIEADGFPKWGAVRQILPDAPPFQTGMPLDNVPRHVHDHHDARCLDAELLKNTGFPQSDTSLITTANLSQEIFGPVQSVLRWDDEAQMIRDVNAVESSMVDVRDLHARSAKGPGTAARVEAGYIWINKTSTHFLGAPFGGYKQSGIGKKRMSSGTDFIHPRDEHSHIIRVKGRVYWFRSEWP